jgi:hypothetical protein
MPKSAFRIFQNSKNGPKMPYFFRSIYERLAFLPKKAQKWGKRRIPRVKIKMHIHSILS